MFVYGGLNILYCNSIHIYVYTHVGNEQSSQCHQYCHVALERLAVYGGSSSSICVNLKSQDFCGLLWRQCHISMVFISIAFKLPKGTPTMVDLSTNQFSTHSMKRFTL